ncbi:methyl-CpG-binding domain-containing family protein [Salix suchowensis]|nr:methyl-CpG-binding domain-containing family protein [Salix suchowensis]
MTLKEHSPATPKTSLAPRSIDIYTVQCEKCSKWRVISTEEEYEEIRSTMKESICLRQKTWHILTWAIDRPGILKTPEGFKRSLELRRDFSRMNAYYITPTGKKLRTLNEITTFIEANPKYQDVKLSAFNSSIGNSNKKKALKDSA